MKTKGINVWEQYIEYVVLLLAIVVFAWFAIGTFSSKIKVQVGKQTLTTATIAEKLLQEASRLEPQFREGAPSPITIHAPEPMGNTFMTRIQQSVSPSQRVIFPAIDMTAGINSSQDVPSELRLYVHPDIAAPKEIRTHQWFGTIRQSEIDRIDELQSSIEGPPHDTSWVQVAAQFDIDEVIASFAAVHDAYEAIPSQWFDEGIDIFDIEIERQILSDGEWEAAEVVTVLPGHLTYRTQLAETTIDAMGRKSIISDLRRGKQVEIANPDFYFLKGASPQQSDVPETWDESESIEDVSPLAMLRRALQRQDKKITRQQKRITSIEEQIVNERENGSGGGSGGRPLGGGGASGGGGDSKLDRLNEKLNNAKIDLGELLQRRIEIADEIELLKTADPENPEAVMSGDIWVWGHDMSVDAGVTYRYRMVIQLANPFYGHKPSLYPEQKPLANKVTIATAASDWSEAIHVKDSKQWFLLGSTQPGTSISPDPLDLGRVSAEIFQFSDGAWVSNVIGVQVGQRLGQPTPDGITTDWFVLDVLEDASGDVVLLQHIETGEVQSLRPQEQAQSLQLQQLRQQVRDQSTLPVDEDKEDIPTPKTPPRGGGGGGGNF